jgi:hypothetical protein
MFLNFDDGKHLIDLYRSRCQGAIPFLADARLYEIQAETNDVPTGVRSYSGYPFRFLASSSLRGSQCTSIDEPGRTPEHHLIRNPSRVD